METKQCVPFLRSKEFLWHEGHTCHATEKEAKDFVDTILSLYREVIEDQLAIYSIKGKKTINETFAGAVYTLSCESYISESGRAIQGCTSHFLGENFSTMYGIKFQDPADANKFIHVNQTCFAITTRLVGVLIMVHGDDVGLSLPPRIAHEQVVIIPVGIKAKSTHEEKEKLHDYCYAMNKELKANGIRSYVDARDNITPGVKFAQTEMYGIPIRIEVGFTEMEEGLVTIMKRNTLTKLDPSPRSNLVTTVKNLLEQIHEEMFAASKAKTLAKVKQVEKWSDFINHLNEKCLLMAPFCGVPDCEDEIKKLSGEASTDVDGKLLMGAKGLNIPFDQPKMADNLKCIRPGCGKAAQFYCLFGRSY
jgi:prolyl-tRNA synthetase family I